jgi:hypothetical protein
MSLMYARPPASCRHAWKRQPHVACKVPKSEFRTRDRSKEIGPPSISLNPYVPEKKRIEMAAILCPPSLASQEIYRPAKLATARSENRHLDLHPPLRLKCSTEIQRIAETLEQRGSTLGASSSTKTALREVNHDKWVQDRDFMPPKRRPEPTPMSFVLSAEAYDDPLLQRKSAQPAAHAARKPRVSCSAGRPLPKSYYTAINEMSVAPPHVAAMSHAVGDERAAAAMQLVASRLQSRNCGTPSFPILGPKMADAL